MRDRRRAMCTSYVGRFATGVASGRLTLLGRDRFASSGRAISSAGSRIIFVETIDQTETGRRWLTMFTFLRLQLKSYINGQQAYKVTQKLKLRRETTTVLIWRPQFSKIFSPIISEKSVMSTHCESLPVPSGIAVLRGVFSIIIRIFANVKFLN